MPNYIRYRQPGGCYFFTVNLANRRSQLLIDEIQWLRRCVSKVKQQRPFHIDAWVVLPEHMHCIWTLPHGDDDFSSRWREIKKAFSRGIPNQEYRSPVQQSRAERGIWQRRFWEHVIRSPKDYQAHLDYLHYNPVKHGWVQAVRDWPYSSFHRWQERGVYPLDWAGEGVPEQLPGK